MGKKTYTVPTCDYPGCTEENGGVEKCMVTIGDRVGRGDLCGPHRRAVEELLKVLPVAGRRGRRRGIEVVDPKDIPRLKPPR